MTRACSGADPPPDGARACVACLRRSDLLARASARLELRSRLRGRLFELLALSDDRLLQALGLDVDGCVQPPREPPRPLEPAERGGAICRHDPDYPSALADDGGPRLVHVRGDPARVTELCAAPAVAICGSARSTDHGIEMARGMARVLAEHGVTLISGLGDAVAAAAQHEAAAARSGSIAVLAGGLTAGCPAPRRALADRIARAGCVIAELPSDCAGRVWGRMAAARILARLAAVTVVLEADDTPVEMSAARAASALGRTVAAVPGRPTSRASRGAHELLIEGAHLVRDAADVLSLLGEKQVTPRPGAAGDAARDPALMQVLEQVGAGSDTPEKLTRGGALEVDVLLALSRLEVLGLLARGDGGRYVACGGSPGGFRGTAQRR